ncbi:MAG: nickel pincer cofactor biosynthesis protein LarB [Myxococcota bacterium]|nr:nickel pincer cofactor biosynthesis protein LarB [Myxococcota bacterium]
MSPQEAATLLRGERNLSYASVDLARLERRGVGEVIFGEGKRPRELLGILTALHEHCGRALATRVPPETYRRLQESLTSLPHRYLEQARCLLVEERPALPAETHGEIVILTAGTSDGAVAAEAEAVLRFMGHPVHRLNDVGVAGLHRLLAHLERLRRASVLIAIAGMEGAMASVLAGLVDRPVIAVPTSVGYGANLQGVTALLSMLNSCASGVSVVNIDNGFGAAYQAAQINRVKRLP